MTFLLLSHLIAADAAPNTIIRAKTVRNESITDLNGSPWSNSETSTTDWLVLIFILFVLIFFFFTVRLFCVRAPYPKWWPECCPDWGVWQSRCICVSLHWSPDSSSSGTSRQHWAADLLQWSHDQLQAARLWTGSGWCDEGKILLPNNSHETLQNLSLLSEWIWPVVSLQKERRAEKISNKGILTILAIDWIYLFCLLGAL